GQLLALEPALLNGLLDSLRCLVGRLLPSSNGLLIQGGTRRGIIDSNLKRANLEPKDEGLDVHIDSEHLQQRSHRLHEVELQLQRGLSTDHTFAPSQRKVDALLEKGRAQVHSQRCFLLVQEGVGRRQRQRAKLDLDPSRQDQAALIKAPKRAAIDL